mmetsp:Transcript_1162/g.2483  ORF Transcript_1162/g.2483 Transcript_1162/m.2483 type:complete len:482 (+) Transcript_1162:570-2015(+)
MHSRNLVLGTEFDFANTWRFEDTTARLHICVHFHLCFVDGRVDDDPRATAKLTIRRNVHKHRVTVNAKFIDNHRTKFQDFTVHVPSTTTETTPVRKDEQRQVFSVVEVTNRGSRLVRTVREPDLARLGQDRFARLRVGRVSRDTLLHQARLNGDDTTRNATEASAASDDRLTPVGQSLSPRVDIEETLRETVFGFDTCKHVTGIIRRLRRHELNLTINRIRRLKCRGLGLRRCWNVRQPLKDRLDAFLVISNLQVGHAVGHHHLRTAKLVLACVHFTSEELVQRQVTSEDERAVRHLDVTLAEATQVRTNPDGASSDIRKRESISVCGRLLTGNHTRTTQVLDTNAMDLADDISELHARFVTVDNLLRRNGALRESFVILGSEVEVSETHARIRFINPSNFEVRLELLDEANARTRVGGNVHTWQTNFARVFGDCIIVVVFLDTKRARHERAIVTNNNNFATSRIFRGLHANVPANHTDVV